MQDATERLDEIVDKVEALVADAEAKLVYLPGVGRVGVAGNLLKGVLEETLMRERQIARLAARPGGMDHSVPKGDRR